MRLSVKSDIDKVMKELTYLERKEIPTAARNAINDTAWKVKNGLDGSTKQYMDRPSPFSQKPTLVRKASTKNLEAAVYVKPKQLQYLRYIIEGKSESGRTVPTKGRRNNYGHLPRTYVKTRKNKKNFFSGKPTGGNRPAGLYERTSRNTKLKSHAIYADSVSHRKVWPFYRIGKKIVNRHFKREMDDEIGYAIKRAARR